MSTSDSSELKIEKKMTIEKQSENCVIIDKTKTGLELNNKNITIFNNGKSKEVENKSLSNLDFNIEMKVNFKDVVRAYKLPKNILSYFLTFKPKKMLNTSELNFELKKSFYDTLKTDLKSYFLNFDDFNTLVSQGENVSGDIAMKDIIGQILTATSQLFHCNGYIIYERKRKDKPSKIKNIIFYNNGIYEYKTLDTLDFTVKFTDKKYIENLFI